MDAIASESFGYQYDLLNRLTAVSGSFSQSTSYSNWSGNIQQKDGISYGYDPNHPHAVTTLDSVSRYSYDANGSMTGRLVDGTQYSLGYDEENRPVTLSGGSLAARYVYDGDGKRVLAVVGDTRTLFVSSAFEVSIEGTPPTFTDPPLENYPLCHYQYCFFMPLLMGGSDNEVLGMQNGNFGTTRYHTHPIEPTATNITWRVYYPGGGLRVHTSSSNTLTYLLTDHLNSTTTTLDSDGDITTWLRYDAWGVTRSSSGTTPTDKRYTGQYEAETGLYFYNARWYDPETGRFAQADTIIPEAGDPLAWDRYAYVNNNPLINNDPSGHCIDGISTYFCILVAGAFVGALVSYGTQVITNIAESGWSVESFTNVDGTAIASAAVAGVVGAGIGIAGAAVVGTGFLATIATGVVGGAASGQASRATTNVLTDQDIGYGLGKPQDILLDGLVGGAFSGVGFGVGAIKNSSFYQGKFPETSTNRFLYKQNGFAEYDIFTGEAKYRVDFSGPSHRGIETPHLHYPNWNQPPKGQKIFNGWDKEIVPYNKILTKIIEGAIRWME